MRHRTSLKGLAYAGLVTALSAIHYGVTSHFSNSDEGGIAWLRRRLNPVLPAATSARRIWIHAVSAGESKVAELLRAALLAERPDLSVVLSATTYSGYTRVEKLAGPAASFVMPLDTPGAQHRLFDTVRPDLLVLVESEYWPAQFEAAEAHGVPVVVVNATLSERSFARHRRFPAIARRTILRAAFIHAQDERTRERYLALGVRTDCLGISGNLKLAASGAAPTGTRARRVVFGNVHRAELPALAPAIAALRQQLPDVQLVLVPRYPGRIPLRELRARLGADLAIVDAPDKLPAAPSLVWLDRMGVLATTYAGAMLGVVCGTFAPIGGHDLSEPLQQGAPSLYGPHTHRQRALFATLSAIGAGEAVTAASLPDAVARLLADETERSACVERYAAAAEAVRGELRHLAASLIARLPG